ncbi:MAG TPA: NADPH-dependent F420 reductase [Acetobacteraceae bacterium]|nr:NADPH-dependent F420 reductase [Acetobacteraceae bacterium]
MTLSFSRFAAPRPRRNICLPVQRPQTEEEFMKIAIIGAGNVGAALGRLWAAKGREITFGVRDPRSAKAADVVRSAGPQARATSVADAASSADIIVLATPWSAAEEVIRSAGDLSGKILIDCINPLLPDLSGLLLGTDTSAGEQVAKWAKGARVVKAFNTTGAGNFSAPRFGSENASMFIAGEDKTAKAVVGALAAELGFDVVDTGPLITARYLEPLAMLWIHLGYREGLGPTGHAFKLLRRSEGAG